MVSTDGVPNAGFLPCLRCRASAVDAIALPVHVAHDNCMPRKDRCAESSFLQFALILTFTVYLPVLDRFWFFHDVPHLVALYIATTKLLNRRHPYCTRVHLISWGFLSIQRALVNCRNLIFSLLSCPACVRPATTTFRRVRPKHRIYSPQQSHAQTER